MNPRGEQEKRALDAMTHGMLSMSLLLEFSKWAHLSSLAAKPLGEFYERFNKTHNSQRFRPFNEGVVLGYLYWLIFAKENWYSLVPEQALTTWGIAPIRLNAPQGQNPTIRYVVRRVRNAMAHSAPTITVPAGSSVATMLEDVTICFHDVGKRSNDTFDLELTLADAIELTKRMHGIVHADVSQRCGVASV